jgi:hypothetical protein
MMPIVLRTARFLACDVQGFASSIRLREQEYQGGEVKIWLTSGKELQFLEYDVADII